MQLSQAYLLLISHATKHAERC